MARRWPIAGPFGVHAGASGMWGEFETTVTLDVSPGPIELIVDDGNGCTPAIPSVVNPTRRSSRCGATSDTQTSSRRSTALDDRLEVGSAGARRDKGQQVRDWVAGAELDDLRSSAHRGVGLDRQ